MHPHAEAPAITVLIAVYNQARYISRAIDSIIHQTTDDWELVLVDDGSTDGTSGIVDTCASRDTRIVVRHLAQNRGLPSALNEGLAIARGEFIARLDGDDIALPDRLAMQRTFLDAHPGVGMVGGSIWYIDSDDRKRGIGRYSTGPANVRAVAARGSAIAAPAMFIRRDCLTRLGGWRTAFTLSEDYDLTLRLLEIADVDNLDAVVTYYRSHDQQATRRYGGPQEAMAQIARISAAARRVGQPDPIERDAPIGPSTVDALDVTPAEAERLRKLLPPGWMS